MKIGSLPVVLGFALTSCATQTADRSVGADSASLDSVNAALIRATRARDPEAYARLHTDSVIFEWPALKTVRGRAALASLMKGNWSTRNDLDLEITVTARHIGRTHATEFAAYREHWQDSHGTRISEFGRYVITLLPAVGGGWSIDHFFGFADSTRSVSKTQ